MGEIKEHQWTIANKQFICTKCGYVANDEEIKNGNLIIYKNLSA
jgi:predicted Zn-ribbon and HTH transcriptional regulator